VVLTSRTSQQADGGDGENDQHDKEKLAHRRIPSTYSTPSMVLKFNTTSDYASP